MNIQVGPVHVEANGFAIHRPYVTAYWLDTRTFGLALGWGDHGCDPVWAVSMVVELSEGLGRLVDRWYRWRERS